MDPADYLNEASWEAANAFGALLENDPVRPGEYRGIDELPAHPAAICAGIAMKWVVGASADLVGNVLAELAYFQREVEGRIRSNGGAVASAFAGLSPEDRSRLQDGDTDLANEIKDRYRRAMSEVEEQDGEFQAAEERWQGYFDAYLTTCSAFKAMIEERGGIEAVLSSDTLSPKLSKSTNTAPGAVGGGCLLPLFLIGTAGLSFLA